jgi:DNA-binding CsgD family transcriptional regulator
MRALCNLLKGGEIAKVLESTARPTMPTAGSNRRLSTVQVEQMIQDYGSGVASIYDLADIYGVHRSTVAQHLKASGVRLRGQPLTSSEIDRADELAKQGLSGNAIGRALARDPKTVRSALLTIAATSRPSEER